MTSEVVQDVGTLAGRLVRTGISCRTTGEVGHDVVALANKAQVGA